MLCTKFSIVYGQCYVKGFLLYIKLFEFSNLSVDDSMKLTSIEN